MKDSWELPSSFCSILKQFFGLVFAFTCFKMKTISRYNLLAKFVLLMASVLLFLSATVSAEEFISAADSSKFSLIHIIREDKVDVWSNRFLEEYLQTGQPPKDWFHYGIWGGVMVVPVPRIENLAEVNIEEVLRKSWYYRDSKEDQMQTAKDKVIVFIMNPKKGSFWLRGLGSNDDDAKKMQRRWLMNPKNLFRANEFNSEFKTGIKRNWRMNITQSGVYDENQIIGHIQDPMGAFGMNSGVVTNSKMIDESKIFIPARLFSDNQPRSVFHSRFKCELLF